MHLFKDIIGTLAIILALIVAGGLTPEYLLVTFTRFCLLLGVALKWAWTQSKSDGDRTMQRLKELAIAATVPLTLIVAAGSLAQETSSRLSIPFLVAGLIAGLILNSGKFIPLPEEVRKVIFGPKGQAIALTLVLIGAWLRASAKQ